ncbi:hypothetical protein ABZ705_27005 [Streptomyces sp. NPDC006984]|uniref:hypothetical protein n=1 Tax=Streptomyces sp. NPDC006984 TaxID=3155463 RepID=UPI0033E90D54
MAPLIHRARAAQHYAARALTHWDTAHPATRLLLAAAALAATQAWDAGHRVPELHPPPRHPGKLVPRDLYTRYQTAGRALAAHDRTCPPCTAAVADTTGRTLRCPDGARLDESLTRLQAAYLTHLKTRP